MAIDARRALEEAQEKLKQLRKVANENSHDAIDEITEVVDEALEFLRDFENRIDKALEQLY